MVFWFEDDDAPSATVVLVGSDEVADVIVSVDDICDCVVEIIC
jgi:hypothetical protein